MKLSTLALLLPLALALSCTRQPVGVTGTTTAPARVTPDSGPPPAPNPRTQEAIDAREPQRAGNVDASDAPVPTRGDTRVLPRNRQVPPDTELSDNQTAQIENQGNVGNITIGDGDRPGTAIDAEQADAEPLMMTYQRSNCYGDCEAYTFDLRSGGLTSLMVDQGEIARGLYNRQLYSVDYEALNNSIDSLRGLELAPVYPVGEEIPTDIPYRSVTLPDAQGQMREVKVYGGAPPALQRFIDRLELMIGEQSWEPVQETPAPDRN